MEFALTPDPEPGEARIYTIDAAVSDQAGNVGSRRMAAVVLDNQGLKLNDANASAADYGESEPVRQLFELNRYIKYPGRRK